MFWPPINESGMVCRGKPSYFLSSPPALRFYDLLHSSSRFFFYVNTLTGVVFNKGGFPLVVTTDLGLGSEALSLPGCWHEGIRDFFFFLSSPAVVMTEEWLVGHSSPRQFARLWFMGRLPAEDTGMARLAALPRVRTGGGHTLLPPRSIPCPCAYS